MKMLIRYKRSAGKLASIIDGLIVAAPFVTSR
jgi:hypothetical protein